MKLLRKSKEKTEVAVLGVIEICWRGFAVLDGLNQAAFLRQQEGGRVFFLIRHKSIFIKFLMRFYF